MHALFLIAALLQPAGSQPVAPASAPAETADGVIRRGAPFTLGQQVTLDDIAKDPQAFAGKTVQVTGKIGSVCQKKGCWMTLNGQTPAAVARVVFKDYGFFAPLDSQGKLATLEGVVEAKVLGEAERAHLAEDAKKPVAEIPAAELRLVASGLEIRAVGH